MHQAQLFEHSQEISSIKKLLTEQHSRIDQSKEISSMKSQIKQLQHSNLYQNDCRDYKILNHQTRALTYNNLLAKSCDKLLTRDWQGPGVYRFGGQFKRMAVKGEVVSTDRCGTAAPGYINDQKAHDIKIGEVKEVQVCFFGSVLLSAKPCHWATRITIKRCPGDFFVYRLPNVPECSLGYCGAQ